MASAALSSLRAAFRAKGSVLVAYSGGVDSAVLAKVASDELGKRGLAVIVASESYAQAELAAALDLARASGFPAEVRTHSELADADYAANPTNRCYFCRKGLADLLGDVARARGFAAIAVGTNTDDLAEWRPGLVALRERNAWQPFLELGINKAGVRAVAKELDLPAWDKPSMACMSSRIPFGEPITAAKLARIEKAEEHLRALGFRQVRVRSIGDLARVEVEPEGVARLRAIFETKVHPALLEAGFLKAEVDPAGYATGRFTLSLLTKP